MQRGCHGQRSRVDEQVSAWCPPVDTSRAASNTACLIDEYKLVWTITGHKSSVCGALHRILPRIWLAGDASAQASFINVDLLVSEAPIL